MKLLLDQNLSRKIIKQIEGIYPDSCHIMSVLTENSSDQHIWVYAKEHGYIIVTKDDDYERQSILLGHPPKVIWIRLGNCKTATVIALLQNSQKIILAFAEDEEKSILTLP